MSADYDNPLDEIRGILEKQRIQEVDPEITSKLKFNSSISSEKMLLNYMSDSPRIFHTTMKDVFGAHISVNTKLSEGFKKATPIILVLGAVMVTAIIMGNSGTLIDAIAKNTGIEKRIEVSKVTEVQIVYLTPEEAAAQGIAVEEAPTGITPDALDRGEDAPLVEPKEIPDDVVLTTNDAFNPRTEGFDVLGNLLPRPIPFQASSATLNQKTCDTDAGYGYVNGDFTGKRTWNYTIGEWHCLNSVGEIGDFVYRGE